jgi:putative DNA primase/helicase
MGYVLAGGTSLQKMFMIVGPKRAGKGTIQRVLTGLLGIHNVAAPTLSSLATNFGLSPLIGKPLAAISDARIGSRSDSYAAAERLLSISGEDAITIDRKYRDPWTGTLPTRFMLLTNEVPRFFDASGALASRFVILTLTTSFLGREDPDLTKRLLAEAPGIFNWAMEGLSRLNDRGHFLMPAASVDALRHLEDLASPVSSFVRDRCVIRSSGQTLKDDLWKAWKLWAEGEGMMTSTKAVLVRDLKAAWPQLKARRIAGEHVIEGIALQPAEDQESEISLQTPARDRSADSVQGSLSGLFSLNHRPVQGCTGVEPTVGPPHGDQGERLTGAESVHEWVKGRADKLNHAAESGLITKREFETQFRVVCHVDQLCGGAS